MTKLRIKKGDKVIVISGSDKGKTGVVLKVFPEDSKVLVSGVAVATRHQKPMGMKPAGLIKKEQPIHISNVMLVDSEGKPTRVGRRKEGEKNVRFAKTTNEVLN
ncbi:MAG: 50S ribosomal protein L24 [Alphaproteobacteria bacterium]|nr:50S ribosomal protein L24 [Alphaproteobacteria bacterium]